MNEKIREIESGKRKGEQDGNLTRPTSTIATVTVNEAIHTQTRSAEIIRDASFFQFCRRPAVFDGTYGILHTPVHAARMRDEITNV